MGVDIKRRFVKDEEETQGSLTQSNTDGDYSESVPVTPGETRSRETFGRTGTVGDTPASPTPDHPTGTAVRTPGTLLDLSPAARRV